MEISKNIFSSSNKEQISTPDSFQQTELKFIPQNQPSYCHLSELNQSRLEHGTQLRVEENQQNDRDIIEQDEEQLMQLKIQLQLRRYTSFQNSFMENHRKVLKQSVEQFLKNISLQRKIVRYVGIPTNNLHVTDFIFNDELFSQSQIKIHKERFDKNIDDYKILKQILSCLHQFNSQIKCQLIILTCYIEQIIQNLIKNIRNPNITHQLQKVSLKVQNYMNANSNIKYLKSSNLSFNSQKQTKTDRNSFIIMCQSWIYTLLIAKLGYFQNQCFDFNVRLEQYCNFHLLQDARGQEFDSQMSIDQDFFSKPSKKIKF